MFKYKSVNYIWYWGPVYFYAALIFYLSSQSRLPGCVSFFPNQDKVMHFFEYGIFCFLIVRAQVFSPYKKISSKAIFVNAILFSSTFGIFDEIHQYFVESREMSFSDFLADFLGGIFIVIILSKTRYISNAQKRRNSEENREPKISN